jgi:hypothetical protein
MVYPAGRDRSMISAKPLATWLAIAIAVLLLATGCGGGSHSAARFKNDSGLAQAYVRGDLIFILKQSINLLRNGGDTLRAEQATQGLVDDMKDAGDLLTTDERRAAIDDANKNLNGLCDRCITMLDDARP